MTKLSKYYIKENDIPQKHLDTARSIIGGGINAETSSNNNTHFYRDTFNYKVIPLKREIAVTYQTVIWCGYSTFVMGLMGRS